MSPTSSGLPPLPVGGRCIAQLASSAFVVSPASAGRTVAAADMPDGTAMRAVVAKPSPNPWDIEVKLRLPVAIAAGETCCLRVWLRSPVPSPETGEGGGPFYIQLCQPPWNQYHRGGLSATTAWTERRISFQPGNDLPAGTHDLAIHLGDRRQEMEFGRAELWSWGVGTPLSVLPVDKVRWPGIETDAPWRAAADERIRRLRMGDVTVRVVDGAGRPIAGAAVHVRMTRHAFPFGTAITAARTLGDTPDDAIYRERLAADFNGIVPENDLKWPALVGDWSAGYTPQRIQSALRWLHGQGFFCRGHTLVWPSWEHFPRALKGLTDKDEIRARIAEHIDRTTALTAGLTHEWDVVNEPFTHHDITDLLGREDMVRWFARARERLPADCRLYINDFGIVAANGATDTVHQAHYEDTIRFLLAKGAPLGGIGVQSHFGTIPTPPETALRILDRFGSFGLPITVTEFDIDSPDETYQAEFTRDYLTVCFSHPSVAGFFTWGFWERAHWRPHAAFYRADWSPRPSHTVWRSLVHGAWWTDVRTTTGVDGTATVRGFKGDHRITVTHGQATVDSTARIGDAGTALTITIA